MPEDTVTHAKLAQTAGVSVTTIKSYRQKFPGFIPVAGFGKPIRFRPEATAVCLLIRDCFAQGLSVRETRKRLETAGFEQDDASMPVPANAGSASDQRMDEFLRAAGTMMQSVAQLAEAQRQTDQRLAKMEELITRLTTSEEESRQRLALLLQQDVATTSKATPPKDSAAQPPRAAPKRIVKVRSSKGKVDAYTLGEPATPPDSLLDVPVALRTDSGDYLGLPGRLTLRRLAELLPDPKLSGATAAPVWTSEAATWKLEIQSPDNSHGLCFEAETTPAGMKLAVMTELFTDGTRATPSQRMEYFRQLKDKYTQT